MEPQVELMNLVQKVIQEDCEITVCMSGTPNNGGISMELSSGYNDSLYYSKEAIKVIPILFLSKDKDQQKCATKLCRICNYLQSLKQYPQSDGFSWLDAVTATEPNLVGRQEDGQWIYSAIINAKIYF